MTEFLLPKEAESPTLPPWLEQLALRSVSGWMETSREAAGQPWALKGRGSVPKWRRWEKKDGGGWKEGLWRQALRQAGPQRIPSSTPASHRFSGRV